MLTANQQLFQYWVHERECIRLCRFHGVEKPWSPDPIMQQTYFCNVDREHDKVTQWIRENFNMRSIPTTHQVVTAMVCARLFNLPASLYPIGTPTADIEGWLRHIINVTDERKRQKLPNFNGAYIVSTNGKKMDKVQYITDMLRHTHTISKAVARCKTLAQAHKALQVVDGLGSFMAAQVVADLKNTLDYPLYNAPDKLTFSSHGPGSLRGLTWFFDLPKVLTAKDYQEYINRAHSIIHKWLPPDLCMQNLQNCMCEYDKYMRILNKTGRSKRKYEGY